MIVAAYVLGMLIGMMIGWLAREARYRARHPKVVNVAMGSVVIKGERFDFGPDGRIIR